MYTLLAISLGIASLLILISPFLRIRTKVRADSPPTYLQHLKQTRTALFDEIDQLHKDMEMKILSKEEFSLQMVLLKDQIAINFMQSEELKNTLATVDVEIHTSNKAEGNSQL
ncbi:hypothetical protein FIM04_04545 [SAR202 cluster bacterium AC-409-J13_OGT_754m]|nr:hypothetical protein [SAR202 cluster bacterium AC-409-J13_OGT_754m]